MASTTQIDRRLFARIWRGHNGLVGVGHNLNIIKFMIIYSSICLTGFVICFVHTHNLSLEKVCIIGRLRDLRRMTLIHSIFIYLLKNLMIPYPYGLQPTVTLQSSNRLLDSDNIDLTLLWLKRRRPCFFWNQQGNTVRYRWRHSFESFNVQHVHARRTSSSLHIIHIKQPVVNPALEKFHHWMAWQMKTGERRSSPSYFSEGNLMNLSGPLESFDSPFEFFTRFTEDDTDYEHCHEDPIYIWTLAQIDH
jgi:hypothetical protein